MRGRGCYHLAASRTTGRTLRPQDQESLQRSDGLQQARQQGVNVATTSPTTHIAIPRMPAVSQSHRVQVQDVTRLEAKPESTPNPKPVPRPNTKSRSCRATRRTPSARSRPPTHSSAKKLEGPFRTGTERARRAEMEPPPRPNPTQPYHTSANPIASLRGISDNDRREQTGPATHPPKSPVPAAIPTPAGWS